VSIRIFGNESRTPSRSAGLRVEILEQREVPANFWWVGGNADEGYSDTDANRAENWRITELVNGKLTEMTWSDNERLPGSVAGERDYVFFEGDPMEQVEEGQPRTFRNCDDFDQGIEVFNTVAVTGGYDKTVTLATAIVMENFFLHSGYISQPVPGTDIVTKNFYWDGGVLNKCETNSQTLLVAGGTATIDPTDEDLITRDSIVFAAVSTTAGVVGAIGAISPGTVAFLGGNGVDVGNACLLTLFPAPATTKAEIWLSLVGTNKEEKRIVIQQGGTVKATTDRTGGVTALGVVTSDLPVLNSGGEFVVENKTNVFLKGHSTPGLATSASYDQSDGKLRIQDGSTLRGEKGLAFSGGKIETCRVIPNFGVHLPATLDGDTSGVTNAGASVVIHADLVKSGSTDVGVLKILGKGYNWQAGEFKPALCGYGIDNSDRIVVEALVVVGANAKLTPDVYKRPQPPGTVVGMVWTILTAGDKIQGAPPALPAPDQLELVPVDNPVKRWDIKGLKDV
jgi:hypothetical protein